MNAKKFLTDCLEDIKVANIIQRELGYLPRSVFGALENWYNDVEVILPISEMLLDDETKKSLIQENLLEMEIAFLKMLEYVDQGNEFTSKTHKELADKVDPLWRELASLHANILNEEFNNLRPRDDEEFNERISIMEEMTGMTRQEIRIRSQEDRRLRRMLCDLGLLPTDLN